MKLPALRADLSIAPQASWRDGQPVWLLKDPLHVRYYRISNMTQQIIRYWDEITPEELVQQLHDKGYTEITLADVESTNDFLIHNQLTQRKNSKDSDALFAEKEKTKTGWLSWLIHHYLFFRVPLVKPHYFLKTTLPWVRWLFSRTWWFITLMVGMYAIYLTTQQWNAFTAPLDHLFSLDGAITVFVAMALVKIIHELGHAYVNTYYGCRVHSMGVAFLVMFPMLYTDTSDAWSLNQSKKRLLIDCSGVLAEIQVMLWSLLLWHLVDSELIKSGITYLITVGLISTLLINMSPLMRFDGYYAFSNALEIDNLQPRSFALARWALRRHLIGLHVPPPFYVSSKKQRLMIIYALVTWIYRFFLFMGIAALVYFMFFKLLGVVLFLIEIVYFIIGPIVQEILYMLRHIKQTKLNRNTLITLSILFLFILILCIPWQTRIVVPGIMVFAHKENIYTALPCRAVQIPIRNQQSAKDKDVLFACESPDLMSQEQLLKLKIKGIEKKIRQEQSMGSILGPKQTGASDFAALQNQLDNIQEEQERLIYRAPFPGIIVNRKNSIGQDRWYSEETYLMSLIQPGQWNVIAYVPEESLYRLRSLGHAVFLSSLPDTPPLTLKLISQSVSRADFLTTPYLASTYGGPLTVNPSTNQSNALHLKQSFFPFVFSVIDASQYVHYEQRGVVVITGARESIIHRLYIHVLSLVIRESSFY